MAVPIAIGIIAGVLFPAYRQAGLLLSFAQAKESILRKKKFVVISE